ncbi:sensor histidine kinase [Pseudokineococcus sp. 1T1Z-3]|uniref:sensor histidine kinase n=1 Tax=Pseudokineococcus sp. 1T1Z-3 TaxID=3132745 RepID=UPI0030AC0805
MDSTWVAAVAGLLCLLVGAGAVLASRVSERRPEPAAVVDDELPAGAADVLSVLSSAAVVIDVADVVVRASAAAHAVGLVRDHELAHEELAAMVAAVRRDGEIRDAEMSLPRNPFASPGVERAGLFVVGVRVAPLGSLHVLVLVEDRTAAKRLEEVRRDFVANVSHELKTPVSAIALLAETMDDAAEDPAAVRRFAQRMTRESQRLSALVQEIVQLSRLQDTDAFHEPVAVDVDEAVLEAVDRTRLVAEGRGVRIVTQLSAEGVGAEQEPGPPAQVWGDRELVITAVRNLVDNGVSYSDAGTRVAVVVSVVDERVEVVVRDQGIGIPESEAGRVFERFYRLDPARSRATGGTGLGLSIVKHVAANHGGDVTLWSRPGEGSTFTLRMPLRRVDAGEPAPQETAGAAP